VPASVDIGDDHTGPRGKRQTAGRGRFRHHQPPERRRARIEPAPTDQPKAALVVIEDLDAGGIGADDLDSRLDDFPIAVATCRSTPREPPQAFDRGRALRPTVGSRHASL